MTDAHRDRARRVGERVGRIRVRFEEIGRRLFVAVPIPDDVGDEVAALVARVRSREDARFGPVDDRLDRPDPDRDDAGDDPRAGRRAWQVRWVRLDGLHLTLRFLGPTAEERIDGLRAVVDAVADEVSSFPVGIGGAGAFPTAERPRALWLGVDDTDGRLAALAATLGEALADAGWSRDDRPFRPHLTLARSDGVRSGPRVVRELIAASAGFRTGFQADRLVLYESHTGGGPARYEPLHEGRFRA